MHTYSTIVMEEIHGSKCAFFKLKENDRCFFDEFENEMTENNMNELKKIIALMDLHANGYLLPLEKFRNIKDKKYPEIFWEFKTKHLRVYTVCIDKGKVVIIGGTKNTQVKDIKRFKRIAIEFLD